MPQVSSRELVRFLPSRGFAEDRQSGGHLVLRHANGTSVTVPMHGGADLGRGLAVRLLKDAAFTVEEYLRLR